MPNGTEKQASSEIAQSRERYDKWADTHKIGAGDGKLLPKGYVRETFAEVWQAAERDTRERVAQEQQENVTALIHIAGSVVRREYLPSLERCRTIRDARAEIERYDSRHVDLAMKIKAVAERIRGKE